MLIPEIRIGHSRRVKIYPIRVDYRSAPPPIKSCDEIMEADRQKCPREQAARMEVWAARATRMAAIQDATRGHPYYLAICSRVNDGIIYMFCEGCPSDLSHTGSSTTHSYMHKVNNDQSGLRARSEST